MSTVFVARRCPWIGCTNVGELEVDEKGHTRWSEHRWLIQDAFPDLSIEEREFLVTGYCPEHMAIVFAPYEDDEDDEDEHEAAHQRERDNPGDETHMVDRRWCQGIGCPYGDD